MWLPVQKTYSRNETVAAIQSGKYTNIRLMAGNSGTAPQGETTNKKGIVNKKPAFATVGMHMIVMLELERMTPVGTFDKEPYLGRFTLRTEGKTVAIGIITKLPPKKDD